MSFLKKLFRNAFFAFCVALDRFIPSRGVPIFVYHSLDASGSSISVTPQRFAQQMGYMAKHGWFTTTLDELTECLRKGHRLPKRRFLVTFDDGFRNALTEALPVLQTFGFTAAVYLSTDFIGRTNSFVTVQMPQYPMLSWDDVKMLKNAGWSIESHGHTHANLPELTPAGIRWELRVSRDQIKKYVDVFARHFCYPRGKYSRAVRQMVREAGYRSAAAFTGGCVRSISDRWALERLPVNDRVNSLHFRALLTTPYGWYMSARRTFGFT